MKIADHTSQTTALAESSIVNGDLARENRQPGQALLSYSVGIKALLSLALTQRWTVSSGVEFLLKREVLSPIRRVLEVETEVEDALSLYDLLVLVHTSWLLEDYATGNQLLDLREKGERSTTPFWREYALCLSHFRNASSYSPSVPKLKGLEKHWVLQVRLASALCSSSAELDSALLTLEESFESRNSNSRLSQDFFGIEGTGLSPVRWDLRTASIILASHRFLNKDIELLKTKCGFPWQ